MTNKLPKIKNDDRHLYQNIVFCLFCIVYIQYNAYTDDERENIVTDKKIIVHFTVLTFCIAYLVSGSLIVLGKLGYRVYSWVNTLPQFCMDIPFAIYILSPAIASYIVLKKNSKTINLWKWSKTVFYVKNNVYPYVFVVAGLVLYFSIHALSLGRIEMVLPFYAFFFPYRAIFLSEVWRKQVGHTSCNQRLIRDLVIFYLVSLQVLFGLYGIFLFFHTGNNT